MLRKNSFRFAVLINQNNHTNKNKEKGKEGGKKVISNFKYKYIRFVRAFRKSIRSIIGKEERKRRLIIRTQFFARSGPVT